MPHPGLLLSIAEASTGRQHVRPPTAAAIRLDSMVLRTHARPRREPVHQGAGARLPQVLRSLVATLALAGGLLAAPAAFAQTVMLSTTMGDIVIQLDAAKAPKSVENFLQYVKSGHYNGTVFHRVIGNFMIQGGGFSADMVQKPTRAPIALESRNGLNNDRGTVAMARTSVPDSATSQFFVNLKNNDFLNSANSRDGNGYAVFGRVISGMDVVDKIAAVETQAVGAQQNVPVKPVKITEAVVQQ